MFKLHLYTVSVEVNRVDKSSELSEDFTLNGTLKDDCSIIDPTIVVASDATIVGFNYAYVEEFKRYYFINNIVAMNNGMWELSMHVDVLMSFKDGLLKLPAWISRNEKEYNPYLIDDRFPIEGATTAKTIGYTLGLESRTSQEYNILAVISSNLYGEAYVEEVKTTYLGGWMPDLPLTGDNVSPRVCPWGTGLIVLALTPQMAAQLLAVISINAEIRDAIIGLYNVAFPFDLNQPSSDWEKLPAGTWFCTTVTATYANNSQYKFEYRGNFTFNVPVYRFKPSGSPMRKSTIKIQTKSFLDYAPYCRRYVGIFGYGYYEVEETYFKKENEEQTIDVESWFDFTNVSMTVIIRINNVPVANLSAPFGSPIPFKKSDMPEIYAAQEAIGIRTMGNVFGTIFGAGANLVQGNISGAITGGVGGIINAITASEAERARLVPSGSTPNTTNDFFKLIFATNNIYEVRCGTEIEEDDPQYLSLNGRPLRQTKVLSEVHGYTEIFNIHLEDFYATSVEKEEIDRKLKSGVILP